MGNEQPTQWWYWFRQVEPGKEPGGWVLCGPHKNYGEAARDRTKSKARDAGLSIPFSATTKEEAAKSPRP